MACALAPNAALLIVARLAQGLAAAAGIVIARAVLTDLLTGLGGPHTAISMATVEVICAALALIVFLAMRRSAASRTG
ncbi:hypothetical protein [Actinomadura sp. 6N118]|uniref:hypothetical protein n=1 Tax=Actinomadura sp. 6N118 TaxID=3375151 RepID=UPI00379579DF